MPILSIVVPIYNKAAYLRASIESILAQTFVDFELILVNDGSTDGCGLICDEFARRDQRVRVLHLTNGGVSNARNRGVEAALGTYVGFADCDDLLEPDMYEVLMRDVKDFKADWASVGVRKVYPDKEELCFGTGDVLQMDRSQGLIAFFQRRIPRSVFDKVFRTALVRQIGFSGSMNEDLYFNFQYISASSRGVFRDEIKYHYIMRPNSATTSGFDQRFVQTLDFSRKMVQQMETESAWLQREVFAYDFRTCLAFVNLAVLSGKEVQFSEELANARARMSIALRYASGNTIGFKHRFSFALYRLNPYLYRLGTSLYWRIKNPYVARTYGQRGSFT